MTADASSLAAEIHASGRQFVLAITGGGSRAIAELLETPGGSRSLLEAVVPYSSSALASWLRAVPEHYCSAETARAMAMASYMRAVELSAGLGSLAGLACTASLASDRPKRGAHRIHVAWQTATATATYSIELVKGRRSRRDEEQVAARLLLNTVAEACDVANRLPLETQADEPLATVRTEAPLAWQELFAGKVAAVYHYGDTVERISLSPLMGEGRPASRRAIFPGAFNPLHAGHLKMAALAEAILGQPVEFEISIENVDKPLLNFTTMKERLTQFQSPPHTLWFTRAPTFIRKAQLFPDTTFIVGADTIRRIADPRYYGGDRAAAAAAIAQIAQCGGRFLVFGRKCGEHFETLEELELPAVLRAMCEAVAPGDFRHDISSTELRKATRGT